MNAHLQRKKNLRREWLLTFTIAVSLLVFLVFADIARPMGNVLYDHFMRLHGFKSSNDIVIVAVDDRSLSELGGWPLSRDNYTQLLDALNADGAQPKAIGFDFLFLDPSAEDQALAQRMRQFNAALPLEFRIQDNPQRSLKPSLPVAPLAQAASIGHINLAFDPDGLIRGIQLNEQTWPHFALLLHAKGQPKSAPDLSDTGYRRFRMVDPTVGFPMVSLSDAIHNSYTRALLKDKYVLIGVTAPSLGDRYPTLYSGINNASTPGVAILASVLHASLNQSLIQTAPPWAIFILGLVPLLTMLYSLLLMQPRHALLLAGGMILLGAGISYALLTYKHYWIDPVPFTLVAILLQPLWAWRRLEAIVNLIETKAADLQQLQPTARAQEAVRPSREVVLQYAKLLDHAVASASSELNLLSLIVDEMPDAVAIFDAQGQLVLGNQKIKQLLSVQTLDATYQLSNLAEQLKLPISALSATNTHTSLDTPQGMHDLLIKTTQLQAPSGEQLRLIILMDITDLRQSQAQRDRALQFLSHDMRTPIASILSLVRPASATSAPPEQHTKIVHHAKALLGMMDDFILTISAEARQYSVKQELLDNLINDALEQVADLAEAKHITLHQEAGDDSVFVMANTRLLVRALVNLLFNAVKFSPANSQISIHVQYNETADPAHCTTITLTNTVEPQEGAQDLIPSMPGFGLGLDFVDTVIRKHQGKITRHIPKSGKATVLITLPCTTA